MSKVIIIKGEKAGKEFIIDLSDPLQTRYELVRELNLSSKPKEITANKYGLSRIMAYHYERAWNQRRWDGLKGKKKGPKTKSKRKPEVEKEIINIRFRQPCKDMYEITDVLREKGYDISSRSVSRVLSEHGMTLKKTKMKK